MVLAHRLNLVSEGEGGWLWQRLIELDDILQRYENRIYVLEKGLK